MKLSCCDICYAKEQKAVMSKYRASIKNGQTRFAIDVCEEHKDWVNQFPKGTPIDQIELEFMKLSSRKAVVVPV